jgi:hypothetical protein
MILKKGILNILIFSFELIAQLEKEKSAKVSLFSFSAIYFPFMF